MKGIYILIINVINNINVRTRSLGKLKFDKGKYAYVGSAQNNLEKRIARHLSIRKKKFWHIDYLLGSRSAKISKVYYKKAGKPEECRIAEELSKKGNAILNFGCSDCSCGAHLFKINKINKAELGVEEL